MPPTASPRTTGFRSAAGEAASWRPSRNPCPTRGGYDLYVKGNQFDTSSEPGIVWVSQDANGDGAPNDTWYELRGSEYDNAETIRGYKITYTRPAEADAPVAWSDNTGGSGTIDRVKEHTQAYYPEWLGEQFTFEGTRLPDNIGKAGEKWTMEPFAWGYADNYSASDRTGMTNRLRISDAVTAMAPRPTSHRSTSSWCRQG